MTYICGYLLSFSPLPFPSLLFLSTILIYFDGKNLAHIRAIKTQMKIPFCLYCLLAFNRTHCILYRLVEKKFHDAFKVYFFHSDRVLRMCASGLPPILQSTHIWKMFISHARWHPAKGSNLEKINLKIMLSLRYGDGP